LACLFWQWTVVADMAVQQKQDEENGDEFVVWNVDGEY